MTSARAQMLSHFLGEPDDVVAARARAIGACMAMAGVAAGVPVTISDRADDWLLLAVAGAPMACTVVRVGGVRPPVAVALLTGSPAGRQSRPGQEHQAGEDDGPGSADPGREDLDCQQPSAGTAVR
ncbi:MAG: hypothetical protein ACLP7J_17075 [Streptosporangiaceae bacterium]